MASSTTVSRRQEIWNGAILYGCVGLGGVIGSCARYLASVFALSQFGPGFPLGTLFVNITGSFVIGFYAALTGPDGRVFAGTRQRQFVMTGICGGYTTFSAFSLQTLALAQEGQWLRAGAYIVASVVLCLVAVWGGYAIAHAVNAAGSGA